MAGGHALRGAATAGLVLIVAETLARSSNGNVGGFFTTVNQLLNRAFSPDVPLIPDRRTGAAGTSAEAQVFNMTPAQLQGVINATTAANAAAAATGPGGLFGPGLSQYTTTGSAPGRYAN